MFLPPSTGAACSREAVSPSVSGVDLGDIVATDDRWGPMPHNKTLFLGYAFLLTMADPTDKLSSCQEPAVSSEEEGECSIAPGRLLGARVALVG